MQNEPNFRNDKMNITPVKTMNYEQRTMNYANKNKPNTNPIRTQFKPNLLDAQMNVSSALTKDYNNEQRTMNNERLCKTKPIKLEAKRRSLRVSFSEFSNRGPIPPPPFLAQKQISLRKKTRKTSNFPKFLIISVVNFVGTIVI